MSVLRKKFALLGVLVGGVAVGLFLCAELVRAMRDAEDYQTGLVSIGFDDFRASDFSLVAPLFSSFGATATFNGHHLRASLGSNEVQRLESLARAGHEIGDHTWRHLNFPFDDPLMNGQDPRAPEGGQVPFPSNEQLRADRGDGRNAFGFPLTDSVNVQLSDFLAYRDHRWSAFETTWGKLTDEQCQTIRNYFSVYANGGGLLDLLDELSNRYRGTSGRSRGSWDKEKGWYTGGVFTGCRTSANHEIWERMLALTRSLYRDGWRRDFSFRTWSWPGSIPSPFLFSANGKTYYDAEHRLPANNLARFPRTRQAEPVVFRSFTEALRTEGYVLTHDATYPSRRDGQAPTMMRHQLYLNASWSRRDALAYPTERTVDYGKIASEYRESRFGHVTNRMAAVLYDDGRSYRDFVEAVRHDVARGLVHGEVIDSQDTFSERTFLEQALAYCRKAGFRVVSKKEAHAWCFGRRFVYGNLIRNGNFRNTAAEFLPEAKTVPANPDGYTGDCQVAADAKGRPVLRTTGETQNLLFGVPTGRRLRYSLDLRGRGEILVRMIRNSDGADLGSCETLSRLSVSAEDFETKDVTLVVPDDPETEYEAQWEGLGRKVMGLQFVYSGGLEIRSPRLEVPSVVTALLSFGRIFK